uniref:rRNA N-glycosylase n=1 Tax=Bougainvillea buttiana TaxID=2136785 RepID=B2ZRV9_9CARY|nr:antiviral protein II [Bougainvillea buttiana]
MGIIWPVVPVLLGNKESILKTEAYNTKEMSRDTQLPDKFVTEYRKITDYRTTSKKESLRLQLVVYQKDKDAVFLVVKWGRAPKLFPGKADKFENHIDRRQSKPKNVFDKSYQIMHGKTINGQEIAKIQMVSEAARFKYSHIGLYWGKPNGKEHQKYCTISPVVNWCTTINKRSEDKFKSSEGSSRIVVEGLEILEPNIAKLETIIGLKVSQHPILKRMIDGELPSDNSNKYLCETSLKAQFPGVKTTILEPNISDHKVKVSMKHTFEDKDKQLSSRYVKRDA